MDVEELKVGKEAGCRCLDCNVVVFDMSNLAGLDNALKLADMPTLELTAGSLLTKIQSGTVFFGILGALLDLLLTRDSWLPGNISLKVSPSDRDFGELDLALPEPELVLLTSIGINDSVWGFEFNLPESL